MRKRSGIHGFSFFELSIVILIIGLLTGGIVLGQSIVRASEIRSITIEANKYKAAVNSFRLKYFALPGDMPNATDMWGAADANPLTCATTIGTGTQTCNGNGDGKIYVFSIAAFVTRQEAFRAWQQLAVAGMVPGSYSGVTSTLPASERDFTADVNAPGSKISGAMYAIIYDDPTISVSLFPNDRGHFLFFGRHDAGGGTYTAPMEPALTPEEAKNLDEKEDDGRPDTGKIMGTTTISGAAPNCAIEKADGNPATLPNDYDYNLSFTTTACPVIIKLDF